MKRLGVLAAVTLAAAVIGTAFALWLGSLPGTLAGGFVAGWCWFALRGARHRSAEQREQARLSAGLWEAARRLPRGSMFEDPVTGCRVAVDREWGFLTVSVADPWDPADAVLARDTLVKSYQLGFLGRLLPPPVYRRTYCQRISKNDPLGFRES